MKKALGICLLLALLLTACGAQSTGNATQQDTISRLPPTVVQNNTVDYDITALGETMAYSQVYQMILDPAPYIGKTVKMQGRYYAAYNETTKQTYHYILITDITACCSEGMEIIWDDGAHAYPEEYPADDALIEVTGTFDEYDVPNSPLTSVCLRTDAITVLAPPVPISQSTPVE